MDERMRGGREREKSGMDGSMDGEERQKETFLISLVFSHVSLSLPDDMVKRD